MRISRKKKPKKPLIPHYRLNDRIRVPELRVLDEEGQYLGEMSTRDALRLAREQELDLVEINPKSNPPVAKIIDFSHFKYQKEKEARKQKAKSHVSELKGIRLSIRIGEHDMNIRLNQAKKFLNRGDKIKVEIMLRGRERGKGDIAFEILKGFASKLEEEFPIKYEQEPQRQGHKVTVILAKK